MYGVFEQTMEILGLEPRPQQVKLVESARQAQPSTPTFVQAGTGTGKSYVVLTTAVEHARRTNKPSVVVCPTNALVDQYVHKDAPEIARATGATFTHLKGRSHYLCANSLAALKEAHATGNDSHSIFMAQMEKHQTVELSAMRLDSEWGCPGSKRCDGDRCGAVMARKAAAGFDVIITNAHVLIWDKRVQDFTGGNARLLPEYGVLLVDECHELEAVGRGCLSDEIGPNSRIYSVVEGFQDWVRKATSELDDDILLKTDDDLDVIRIEAMGLLTQLERDMAQALSDSDELAVRDMDGDINAIERFLSLFVQEDEFGAHYLSILTADRTIRRPCIDASALMRRILTQQPSILVSGTVPGSLPRRLGVGSAQVGDVGHPFNYRKSTLAISSLSPKKPMDRAGRVDQLVRAIVQTGGGTLVLFTSWADLTEIMTQVNAKLNEFRTSPDDFPILLQSQGDPVDTQLMIKEFKEHGNAVLAGVRTLFTGLDIPGRALRQVVLWKMPYPVPTLESQAIEAIHGRQVYWDEMLTLLVQAIGRLIRNHEDEGRIIILDSRAKNQRWRSSGLTRHLAEFSPPKVPSGIVS